MKMTAMPRAAMLRMEFEQRRGLLLRQNGGRLVENKQLEIAPCSARARSR